MTTPVPRRAATALAAVALCLVASPAAATPTSAVELACGSGTYSVTGFGRGQALHVVGSTARFVPTHVALAEGVVVFDAPGHADAVTETCTAASPVSGRSLTFTGFFTPQAP